MDLFISILGWITFSAAIFLVVFKLWMWVSAKFKLGIYVMKKYPLHRLGEIDEAYQTRKVWTWGLNLIIRNRGFAFFFFNREVAPIDKSK